MSQGPYRDAPTMDQPDAWDELAEAVRDYGHAQAALAAAKAKLVAARQTLHNKGYEGRLATLGRLIENGS